MFIDPHVHFRDFNQSHKETISHGLKVARDSGVDAVFDMPNTDPPTTTLELAIKRIELAKNSGIPEVFYGLYLGLTSNLEQIKKAVEAFHKQPEIIGFKLYAGHSVGNMGIISLESQRLIYQTLTKLGFNGVMAVHCEKESLLLPKIWNPKRPISHCQARPERAEIESVKDQINLTKETGFTGKLHIAHVSSPTSVDLIVQAKREGLNISCGICPHHFIFDFHKYQKNDGILWKTNPPLRRPKTREKMLELLKNEKIDWIETDHAPHTLAEKTNYPYLSGIPGLAWWPLFFKFLKNHGLSADLIKKLTFSNAAKRFDLKINPTNRPLHNCQFDYPFDPYTNLSF